MSAGLPERSRRLYPTLAAYIILGETAMQRAGVVRSRQLNGMLAQHLRKHLRAEEQRLRLPDVRTKIQLAKFMMRSDPASDPDAIIDAAASAMTMSNIALGEELARFALDRGGGLAAAVVFAEAMGWQGRGDEVEAVLADVDPYGADELLTAIHRLASNPSCKFFANSPTASPAAAWAARANLDGRPRELDCVRVVVAVLLTLRQGPYQRTRS